MGPDDPVEDHPYLFQKVSEKDEKPFEAVEIEGMIRRKAARGATPTAHAQINNEYGWLWLNRDGAPTKLTGKRCTSTCWDANASPEDRFALDAYLLGGLNRVLARLPQLCRRAAFRVSDGCYPGAYTCDNFRDVAALELEPHFADYMREAFKPLGVYHELLAADSSGRVPAGASP